ncbi:MAG: 50S ribosome-binding GTPase [Methylomonas sp.]|nr:50S ribosome-binding GTPase [Methylomonas sp.]PPD21948.1 MAG: hypothetical protein CTY23_03775 [Methylomonas sp.]PPD25730.1 MAG: hypothetical protein CTY22_07510 [Methylomonas sp.]PPD36983.1 MAG: hypothetical protein CTY21_07510 [Methylomonas sp.]PPD39114.1 MAG: hypothetical protein CTY17_08465 [Methylomonas sp.]
MNLKHRWRMLAISVALPLMVPLLAGVYWLWLNHWLLGWVAASAALALIWWGVSRILEKLKPEPQWLDISPSLVNTPQSELAWQRVAAISAEVRKQDHDLGDSSFYLQTLTQVMNAVAEVYHPQQKQAILEVKIPYLLKVIEVFARELRLAFSENIPGSHVFSINDLAKGRRIASKGRELYRLFRVVTAGFDPVTTLIRELRVFANSQLLASSTDDLKRWLIDAYIKKVGFYAIELYSGNMVLDDDDLRKPTRRTQREINTIRQRQRQSQRNAEPFQILLAGKANSGKASLINALAGQSLAVADTLPHPLDKASHFVRDKQFPSPLILQRWRYHEAQTNEEFQALLEKAGNSDLAIIVVSSVDPARQLDKTMLQHLRQLPNAPRIIVALTHIDKLRPLREWNPPYNWAKPASAKAEAIKLTMTELARCLDIGVEFIVPLCLHPERIYNCQEQFVALMVQQLEQASQRKYLRSLHDYQHEAKRRMLRRQMLRSGYWMSRLGDYLITQARQSTAHGPRA